MFFFSINKVPLEIPHSAPPKNSNDQQQKATQFAIQNESVVVVQTHIRIGEIWDSNGSLSGEEEKINEPQNKNTAQQKPRKKTKEKHRAYPAKASSETIISFAERERGNARQHPTSSEFLK